ncbi:hypothetical protein [Psychromonas sp. SP041]|uniref:hypothetical protein n=1 Tax=Psychromonas sp. SP041 TaxID=1365007 RepID=UPI0010C7BD70|nr:hypothetical protein [Psychromonas sp. SP041]
MSTHRDEIDHFEKTVKEMGGQMTLGLCSKGYVDDISVKGLDGISDFNKLPPILAMETLRPVVGPIASRPSFSKTEPGLVGIDTFIFSESQGKCYGGTNRLVNILNSAGRIWEGEKFAAKITAVGQTEKFFCLTDGDLQEFETKDDLLKFNPKQSGFDNGYDA